MVEPKHPSPEQVEIWKRQEMKKKGKLISAVMLFLGTALMIPVLLITVSLYSKAIFPVMPAFIASLYLELFLAQQAIDAHRLGFWEDY